MQTFLVVVCIIVLALIIGIKYLTRKDAVVGAYDFLEVLTLSIWKPMRQIRDEMEKLKGGRVALAVVYACLEQLEVEELVERRERVPLREESDRKGSRVREYRLTEGGLRVKNDVKNPAPASPSVMQIPA